MNTPPAASGAAPADAREAFESLANKDAACGLKRSLRGTYVNPVIARDWKWFRLGREHAALASREATVPELPDVPSTWQEPGESDDAWIDRITGAAALASPQVGPEGWMPIATAPRDGTNILIRFGQDCTSQAKYIPGTPYPWQFIDTNDGITWLINHSVDKPGYGPSHWKWLDWADGDAYERKKAREEPLVGEQVPLSASSHQPQQQSGETGGIVGRAAPVQVAPALTDAQRTRFSHLKEAHKYMQPLDGTTIKGKDLFALLDFALSTPAAKPAEPTQGDAK